MTNYIRASFCVDHLVSTDQFYRLLQALDTCNCRYNIWSLGESGGYLTDHNQDVGFTEEILDQQVDLIKLREFAGWLARSGHVEISFGWNVQGHVYDVRLLRSSQGQRIRIMLAVEEAAFPLLPGTWSPYPVDTIVFESFKQMLIHIVRSIHPLVGVIGYEIDLLCDSLDGLGVGWGNFLSESALSRWPQKDVQALHSLVDEYIPVDNLGVIVFIHSSEPQQVWKRRERQVEMLMHRNSIL